MLRRSMLVRSLVCCALGAAAATLSGCLISSHSNESFTGTRVSDATFNRIEPGVTTQQWITGTLGEPSIKTKLEDGSELWKWQYAKVKSSSGAILFVFGGSSTSTQASAAYVQLKDGIVTKCWRAD